LIALVQKFTAKSAGEKKLKIREQLAKLEASVAYIALFPDTVYNKETNTTKRPDVLAYTRDSNALSFSKIAKQCSGNIKAAAFKRKSDRNTAQSLAVT